MRYIFEDRKVSLFTFPITNGLSPQPHIHLHLELIYLTAGSSFMSLDGKEYFVQAGDLFLAFPNQIHFYHDCGETAGYVIIFAGDLFSDFSELFKGKVPIEPVIHRKDLPDDIAQRFHYVTEKGRSERSSDRIAAKGYMLTVLADVLPLLRLADTPVSQDSIKSVLMYCMQNYTEPLTLDTLARDLHLSKYYISHIFQKRMEIGFSEFVNSLRLEHACELLSRDTSITEVAYASGFSSIRSFNGIFLDKMGMTPSQYVKAKRLEEQQ